MEKKDKELKLTPIQLILRRLQLCLSLGIPCPLMRLPLQLFIQLHVLQLPPRLSILQILKLMRLDFVGLLRRSYPLKLELGLPQLQDLRFISTTGALLGLGFKSRVLATQMVELPLLPVRVHGLGAQKIELAAHLVELARRLELAQRHEGF